MTANTPSSTNVDERLLVEKLDQIGATFPGHDDLLRVLQAFVRTAPEARLVRINPVRFAAEHGIDERAALDLFLHARKAGLFTMEWQYVCPGCGEIVESFESLGAAGTHYFCGICRAEREAELSDFIEITFSVSRAARESRYHDPRSLDIEAYTLGYRFTENGVVDGGPWLRDFYRERALIMAYVEPGESKAFRVRIEPGLLFFTDGPVVEVRADARRSKDPVAFTSRPGQAPPQKVIAAPGPFEFIFTNAGTKRKALLGIHVADYFSVTLQRFLSGSRLLASQTFRDLFPSETVMAGEGIAVRHAALLFTDIKGSTALYDRVGDMRAFDLVRGHFGVLRECIARNSGALVKTIGDAVMASFDTPAHAVEAALEARAAVARYNATAGDNLITLKIGAHAGSCLAVTQNGKLDYFGQAVNLAARIQRLAAPGEICLSEEVYRDAEAGEKLAAHDVDVHSMRVNGIEREIVVYRLRGDPAFAGSS